MPCEVTFTLVVTRYGHTTPTATVVFDVDGDGGIIHDTPVDMVPKEAGTLVVTIPCKKDDPKGLFGSVNVTARPGAHCSITITSGGRHYKGREADMAAATGWWMLSLVEEK